MATTWETIRKRACRRYGLLPEVEDALLNIPLFLDRVNECLQEMATVAHGFHEDLTLDLPTTALVTLSSRVLQVLDNTVRLDQDGDGVFECTPEFGQESDLRGSFTSLEGSSAGTPAYYYLQRGSAGDAMLTLALYPRSRVAVTGGLKLSARTSPAPVVNATDTLPLQLAEERFLVPGICLALAEVELSRGRRDAPLQLWDQRWEKSLVDYADAVETSVRGDTRRVIYTGDKENSSRGYW